MHKFAQQSPGFKSTILVDSERFYNITSVEYVRIYDPWKVAFSRQPTDGQNGWSEYKMNGSSTVY